jgi:hypothetical protein
VDSNVLESSTISIVRTIDGLGKSDRGTGYSRKDKTISVDPVWVFGVEGHEFVEENMGDGRHAHGSSGMTGVRCKGGIDLFSQARELEKLLNQLEELQRRGESRKHTR